MTQTKFFRLGLHALALTVLCAGLASTVCGDDAPTRTVPAPAVTGIALQDGGLLYGQVLDARKQPLANQEVRILSQGRLVIAVKTNARGQFGVRGLRGGLHTIEATGSRQTVQFWAPRTAPPSAERIAVMVVRPESIGRDPVVRAQGNGNDYGPAVRGAVAGGLATGLTYWAIDEANDDPASP
jgi:hypothetical protein